MNDREEIEELLTLYKARVERSFEKPDVKLHQINHFRRTFREFAEGRAELRIIFCRDVANGI